MSSSTLCDLIPEFNSSNRCSNPICREVLKTVPVRKVPYPKQRKRTKNPFRLFPRLEIDPTVYMESVPPFCRKESSAATSTLRGLRKGKLICGVPQEGAPPDGRPVSRKVCSVESLLHENLPGSFTRAVRRQKCFSSCPYFGSWPGHLGRLRANRSTGV